MNDEQIFLASAYLDGELTDDERRIAEADPEVMAEVEELRALQAELRDVPPPSDAVREAALSAAMAEFGTARVEVAPAAPEPRRAPIPFRPRPAYARYLGYAAALVAVAGLGIIVSQADFGSGDDAADVADDAAAERLVESTADAGGDAGAEDESATMAAADAGDDAMSDAGGAAEDTMESAAADMAEEAAPEAELATDGGDGGAADEDTGELRVAVPPDFDPDRPITDEADLAVFGAFLRAERDAGTLAPTPNTPCVRDDDVLRRAALVVDDTVVPVLIAVDDVGGTFAIDEDSCAVLLEAP